MLVVRLPSTTVEITLLFISAGLEQKCCSTFSPNSLIATTVSVDGRSMGGGELEGGTLYVGLGSNGGETGGSGLVLRNSFSNTSESAIAHSPARNVEHVVL